MKPNANGTRTTWSSETSQLLQSEAAAHRMKSVADEVNVLFQSRLILQIGTPGTQASSFRVEVQGAMDAVVLVPLRLQRKDKRRKERVHCACRAECIDGHTSLRQQCHQPRTHCVNIRCTEKAETSDTRSLGVGNFFSRTCSPASRELPNAAKCSNAGPKFPSLGDPASSLSTAADVDGLDGERISTT